jgi:uncharacterized cupin superfamily protein
LNKFLELHNRHTGETLRIRRVRSPEGQDFRPDVSLNSLDRDTKGQSSNRPTTTILILEGTLPPGTTGPPLHIHFQEREEGNVHAGTLGAQIGNQKTVLPAGSSAVFPAGVVHKWWNAGTDLLDFRGQVVPVVADSLFAVCLYAVIPQRFTARNLLLLFTGAPVIVSLGHILGKYRGNDWPGSPASCPGAPEP